MKPKFEVDPKGLAKLIEKQGKAWVVFELLQNAIDEANDKAEQAWGASEEAEKHAKRTEKFVIGAVAFMTLLIALIECLT